MNRAATLALMPFGGLYAAATKARLALYQSGALAAKDVGAPVISVGNITAGGTGKTPLVAWIARRLDEDGRRVCVLTRGYGRTNPNQRIVVSDGTAVLADAEAAGDEPLLLAEELSGRAVVISDRDRVAAARWAIENFRSDAFVLDDGFQHLRIARQLNIVIVDATNPWSNGRVLPAGLLREPRSGLSRADCVIITRANQVKSIDTLRQDIDRLSQGRPVFLSRMKSRGLQLISGSDFSNQAPDNSLRVGAFCAIGNPRSFFDQLRREDRTLVATRAFRDHHHYTQADVDLVVREATAAGAGGLITTAKDEVKLRALRFDLPCYAARIEIEIEGEDRLAEMIRTATEVA